MLKKEYKFIIFLLIVCGIFFYQFLLFGKVPFPGDLLVSEYNPWETYSFLGFAPGGMPNKAQYFDVIRQLYPWRMLDIESFAHLTIPLWNPYNFSGTPLLANNQSAVWYPLNILFLFLQPAIAWSLLVMLQPLLASIGTYFFARKIGIGKWGSCLAGIAYGYSLFQSVFLEYNTIGHVIALLPWALVGLELFVSKRKSWGSFLFVGAVAAAFFAGHIQVWMFAVLFLFAYGIFRIRSFPKKYILGLQMSILFLMTLLIISVQLLPTLELIQYAARVPQNYQFLVTNLLLQPYQLFLLIIPDLFGNPATRNYLLSDAYPGNALYVGLLPVLFALYAIIERKVSRPVIFFVGAIGVLLVFLVKTPFTEVFYKVQIPFFSTGSPSNALFLVSFSFAILAGFGFELYVQHYTKGIGRLLAIVVVLFGFVFLFSKIFHIPIQQKNVLFSLVLFSSGSLLILLGYIVKKKQAILALCIILFTIGDLFYFFHKFNPFSSPALIYPPTALFTTVQKLAGTQRVWSYGTATIDPNVLSLYHIADPNGYDPLYPKSYGEFISSSKNGKIQTMFTNQSRSDAVIAPAFREEDLDSNPYRFRLLDAISVSYILSRDTLSNSFLEKHNWQLASSQDGWNIYRNLSALPHTYFVGSYDTYSDAKSFSEKFYAQSFDPHRVVLLQQPVGSLSGSKGNARILRYMPEEMSIKTDTDGRQLLVVTDTFFPGWKASMDGKEIPILRANYTFRAVIVPPGVHTVVFSYQPASFFLGVILTIMGLGGLIGYVLLVQKMRD